MPRRARHLLTTAARLAELGFAAPRVAAHRLARMALADPVPSARDRREFTAMIAEKQAAFAQAWLAMFTEGLHAQQALAASWLRMFSATTASSHAAWQRAHAAAVSDAMARVAGRGLVPVHRKAVANARRLAKTKLR